MAEVVYLLCALMSIICAVMLTRGFRHSGTKLLLWAAISFVLIACNNILLFVDLAVFPEANFHGPFWRNLMGATSGFIMLFGLIWELV